MDRDRQMTRKWQKIMLGEGGGEGVVVVLGLVLELEGMGGDTGTQGSRV